MSTKINCLGEIIKVPSDCYPSLKDYKLKVIRKETEKILINPRLYLKHLK